MERWFIKNKVADYKKIARDFKISEFLSKLLVNRDIIDYNLIDSFISSSLDRLHDPSLMKDLLKGADIIRDKIINKRKIRIVGDYDVDGVISIYLLYTGIKKCGGNVDYVIPSRINDGYGINNEIVREAEKDGIDTIITCDNGIAAIEQIKLAKELGLTVIVTDHHDLPFVVDEAGEKKYLSTEADAVINPKQKDCNYPFKGLCGAAVVFKLIQKLYFIFELPLESTYCLLEYTAIATICDVVDLIDENRIIVKKGLELLNNTENIGLKALIKETGVEDKEIGVYHIGFIIGPSINASGRLDSALKALELLLSNDLDHANLLAKELRELNEERKQMTIDGVEKIINIIENSEIKKDKILVIYEPEIHESIAGIIAGRIKEKYNRPTIVLTQGKDGVKGSGRSIEGYNMFEEISECKDLLLKFGGHPMAAGLSLEETNISQFRKKLNENTSLTDDDLISRIYIDMQLPLEYISFKLIDELKLLEPFGKGNNKPIFGEKNLKINRGFVLGANKNVLKLILENENRKIIEGIFFGDIMTFENRINEIYGKGELDKIYKGIGNNIKLDILFYPSVNEYNGNTNLQVTIQNYRINK
ncbi:single-stranded-DNA-specific exonuclease RecJ [Tissierella carlieri]|uniref:Single-stranded-DNA-specific exonuclease RecJ n=1 Tax=Tissierella carlieri TaxID=689904 RepID=A0ABT1S5Z5_9FIRM|nr:single-stranded-DNA-specific exonuclease RecJ [Tissierella carlieri]MBU5314126.1 single-stranded-DNA-specific exonuclease RecJ [Tissierella carlieri]MCQ4921893.1 single-stranded-DNA-specific exonuclease RecJ [Tissierella carlieri]